MLLGDPALAVALGTQVLARQPDDAATRDLVVIAYEAMGDHARATATSTTVDPAGATARARHATNVYLATLDAGTAHQVAPAVAAAEDNGEAAALLGWMQLLMGDLDDACATASPVLEDPASSVQARVWAGLDVAVADVLRGGGPECLDLLDLSRRIAVAQPAGLTPYSEFQVATSRCVALVRLGRGTEALPAAEAGLAGTSDPQLQAAWHGVAGLAARETGEFERGSRHFAAIGDILSGDPFGLGTWAASESAVCAFMRGAPPPAAPAQTNPIGLTEAVLARNAAWCLAPADRRSAADLALGAADTARQHGQSTNEVLALVDAARWGRASTAATAIGAILRVDNPLILAGGAVISAWLRQRPAELVAAARTAADVGWWVVREELLVLARSRLVADAQPTAAARLELVLRPQRWPTPLLLDRRHPGVPHPARDRARATGGGRRTVRRDRAAARGLAADRRQPARPGLRQVRSDRAADARRRLGRPSDRPAVDPAAVERRTALAILARARSAAANEDGLSREWGRSPGCSAAAGSCRSSRRPTRRRRRRRSRCRRSRRSSSSRARPRWGCPLRLPVTWP